MIRLSRALTSLLSFSPPPIFSNSGQLSPPPSSPFAVAMAQAPLQAEPLPGSALPPSKCCDDDHVGEALVLMPAEGGATESAAHRI